MIQNIIVEENLLGKDYVCGDIHGCYDQLLRRLREVNFDKTKDRLFSVGDLIDRGDQNLECLNLLYEPWFYAVLGNHERMMIDAAFDHYNIGLWLSNGGDWSMQYSPVELLDYKDALMKMPITISLKTKYGKIGFSHAQCPTEDWNDCEQSLLTSHDIEVALWSRKTIRNKERIRCKNVDLTIHGHTVLLKPTMLRNALFIDTGSFLRNCGYPGITLFRVDDILNKIGDLVYENHIKVS